MAILNPSDTQYYTYMQRKNTFSKGYNCHISHMPNTADKSKILGEIFQIDREQICSLEFLIQTFVL